MRKFVTTIVLLAVAALGSGLAAASSTPVETKESGAMVIGGDALAGRDTPAGAVEYAANLVSDR